MIRLGMHMFGTYVDETIITMDTLGFVPSNSIWHATHWIGQLKHARLVIF